MVSREKLAEKGSERFASQSSAAASGRKFRALSVVGPYMRECLALEVDTSLGSRRVTRVLEGIIAECGAPQAIRSDNGPEFVAKELRKWLGNLGTGTLYIEPGSPWRTATAKASTGSCETNA